MKYLILVLLIITIAISGFLYFPNKNTEQITITSEKPIPEDILYISSSDGLITKLNMNSMNTLWDFNADSEYRYYSSRVLIESEGILYATGSDGSIRLINMSNGVQIDMLNISGGRPQSMAIDDDSIYLGLQISENTSVIGGKIIALDKNSFELLWELDEDPYSQPLVIHDSFLYSGITYSTLVKINKETGEIIWASNEHSHPINTIVAQENVLYTAASDGRVRMINSSSGKNMWGLTRTIRESNIDSMAVGMDGIYIGTIYNEIVKFPLNSSTELWRIDNHTADINQIVTYKDSVISVSSDGKVLVLNSSTGDIMGKIENSAKRYIEVIAIDEN